MSDKTYTFYKDESAKVGKGTAVNHGSILKEDTKLGDKCTVGCYTLIDKGASVGKNTKIGSFCSIGEGVKIGSNVEILEHVSIPKGSIIEDYVFIGTGALFTNISRIAHFRGFDAVVSGVHVCKGARIAPGAMILPGVKIGKESLVGTGTIITKDVPDREIWFGFPAIKRGTIPESEYLVIPKSKA